jgi:predicted Fe-Mo cluster-binding NifX family protein
MKDGWRVAIASLDGKVINEHFGRAKEFYIVDIAPDGSYQYVGRREVIPLCDGGEHQADALQNSAEALRDCTAVLVARIGPAAKRGLEINGIAVYEHPDAIENAIPKLARYYVQTNYQNLEEKQ